MSRTIKTLFGLATVSFLASPPAAAQWECQVSTAAPGQVSVCTYPDGGGYSLDACFLLGGTLVDATITLTLLDWSWNPIVGFPAEDLWLETTDGGLILCPGGSVADGPTDNNGQTTFSGPIRGGGATDLSEGVLVMVAGAPCLGNPLDIQFNSPDLNGDLVVNLSDVALFSGVFWGSYAYAADLHWNGYINLSDLVLLARAWGAACP